MANLVFPDAILVKNYISGDESALTSLIERHQSKIYGFIYSKVNDRDLSDDIFQDTFIKVIKTLKTKSYTIIISVKLIRFNQSFFFRIFIKINEL